VRKVGELRQRQRLAELDVVRMQQRPQARLQLKFYPPVQSQATVLLQDVWRDAQQSIQERTAAAARCFSE